MNENLPDLKICSPEEGEILRSSGKKQKNLKVYVVGTLIISIMDELSDCGVIRSEKSSEVFKILEVDDLNEEVLSP
jgi:hypothetical protein